MKEYQTKKSMNFYSDNPNLFSDMEEIILSVMPIGKENAQNKKYFVSLLGIKERDFRDIIHSLRLKGIPICSNTTNGYWVCKNKQELDEFILFLESYCTNIEDVLDSMYTIINNI